MIKIIVILFGKVTNVSAQVSYYIDPINGNDINTGGGSEYRAGNYK